MGLVGIVVKVVGAIVLLIVGIGAYLYFTDYEAKATITDRGTAAPCFVVVTPKIAPWIDYKAAIPCDKARIVCEGYQVNYRLQTKAFAVVDGAGKVVYDSRNPTLPVLNALDCSRV